MKRVAWKKENEYFCNALQLITSLFQINIKDNINTFTKSFNLSSSRNFETSDDRVRICTFKEFFFLFLIENRN